METGKIKMKLSADLVPYEYEPTSGQFEYINEYGSPSRTQIFEYINEYGSPSRIRLCTQISEYGMATRTRLCTQISEYGFWRKSPNFLKCNFFFKSSIFIYKTVAGQFAMSLGSYIWAQKY